MLLLISSACRDLQRDIAHYKNYSDSPRMVPCMSSHILLPLISDKTLSWYVVPPSRRATTRHIELILRRTLSILMTIFRSTTSNESLPPGMSVGNFLATLSITCLDRNSIKISSNLGHVSVRLIKL